MLAETGQRLIVLSDVIARRGQLERHRPQAEGGPSRDLLSARLSSHALDPPPADERAAGVVPFARRPPFTLPRGWVASGASGSLVSAVVTERGLDVA